MEIFKRQKRFTNHEELMEHLNALCRQNGFDYALYLGEYKGESVYKPMFNNPDVLYGRPCYLHVKNGRVRRSKNFAEVSEVMHHFFRDGHLIASQPVSQ